jgi:uncharacterized protein YlzI (FlbEa/FlbD family)
LSTQSYFDVTDEAKKVKGLKSKLVNGEGKPLAAIFGKSGDRNPVAEFEKYSKQSAAKDNSRNFGGSATLSAPRMTTSVKNSSGISRDDYDYLKKIGVASTDNYKTVLAKVKSYENKQATRYSKYKLGVTDYKYVSDMISSQIPKGVKISGSTGILQPLDTNMKPKGGNITRGDFEDDFYVDGKSAIHDIEFVPAVGLVITTSNGKKFKVGKGGIKDQLDVITDKNSEFRQEIDMLIDAGYYQSANNKISELKDAIIPRITNAQVSPNSVQLPN